MRHTILFAQLLLITALFGGCLGRLPLALRKPAPEMARGLEHNAMARGDKDRYCAAVDEWISYFVPTWAPKGHSLLMERALPAFLSAFAPLAKEALQGVFEKAHVEAFNDPLDHLIFGLKETNKRLTNCNHCADHFVGMVFKELLIGHASNPTVKMDEKQFTERLIKFFGQVADSLEKAVAAKPPPAKLQFDGFWDLLYKAVDDSCDGENDFGGLLTPENLLRLGDIFGKDYVVTAFKTEGQKVYKENLKCTIPA